MPDRIDTKPQGWTGRLFDTYWLNNNPLVASYQGYPFQVRGTDPASYEDAMKWVGSGMASSPTTAAGAPSSGMSSLNPFGGLGDWLNSTGKAFAIGVGGVWVGSIILAIGVLVLVFGTDSGRKVVKAAAAA